MMENLSQKCVDLLLEQIQSQTKDKVWGPYTCVEVGAYRDETLRRERREGFYGYVHLVPIVEGIDEDTLIRPMITLCHAISMPIKMIRVSNCDINDIVRAAQMALQQAFPINISNR